MGLDVSATDVSLVGMGQSRTCRSDNSYLGDDAPPWNHVEAYEWPPPSFHSDNLISMQTD